mmetsp:Transcript_18356/g.45653  ORF Transcript_18356/g.45653 Transcript_18356/m.45653 type:complete len:298 (-) Transcript_18356:100-993(-)
MGAPACSQKMATSTSTLSQNATMAFRSFRFTVTSTGAPPVPVVLLPSWSYRRMASSAVSNEMEVCRAWPTGALGSMKLDSFRLRAGGGPMPPPKSSPPPPPPSPSWSSGRQETVMSFWPDWKWLSRRPNSRGRITSLTGMVLGSMVALRCSASVTQCTPYVLVTPRVRPHSSSTAILARSPGAWLSTTRSRRCVRRAAIRCLASTAVCRVPPPPPPPCSSCTVNRSNEALLNRTEQNADRALFMAFSVSPLPAVASMRISAPIFAKHATLLKNVLSREPDNASSMTECSCLLLSHSL